MLYLIHCCMLTRKRCALYYISVLCMIRKLGCLYVQAMIQVKIVFFKATFNGLIDHWIYQVSLSTICLMFAFILSFIIRLSFLYHWSILIEVVKVITPVKYFKKSLHKRDFLHTPQYQLYVPSWTPLNLNTAQVFANAQNPFLLKSPRANIIK